MPDTFREGQTVRHQPHRPDRLLLAVAELDAAPEPLGPLRPDGRVRMVVRHLGQVRVGPPAFVAAHAHGAEIVDLYSASRQEVPRRPELIGADGYHPSDEGYARWADLMWAAIEGRIAR